MDFKIGDDFTEKGPVKRNVLNDKNKMFVIIGGAILLGIVVFVLLYLILGNTNETSTKKVNNKVVLSLDDKNVVSSYKMITYGYNQGRNDKFLMGIELNNDSFSNQEKYYYALQFCVLSDLIKTNDTDDNGNIIYTLPKDYMDIYMERFFGKDITYDTSSIITNTFKFKVGSFNTGTLTYDENNELFKIVFTSYNDKIESQDDIYYKLYNAYSYDDGRLILEEKIIYTKIEEINGKKSMILYSDKNNTDTLGTINDIVTESNGASDDLTINDIDYYAHIPLSFDFDEYKDKALTVTYNFKLGSYGYYFVNSKIN